MLDSRPRPAIWRLVLVSGAQIAIAAWVTTILSLTLQTTFREAVTLQMIAAGALALSLFILWLWPSGPSLASRMGVYDTAASIAAFGAVHVVERDPYLHAAASSLALLICVAVWRRHLSLLGNVYDVPRLAVRLGITLVAIVPPLALIAAVTLWKWEYAPLWGTSVFAAAALFAALPRPPVKFEQLTRIELREPVAPLTIALAVVASATAAWPDLLRFGIPLHRVLSFAISFHRV